MSFLARLFGKKTSAKTTLKQQPKAAEKKATNLEALSLDALITVIKSGEDEPLRVAAIQKISDQETLLSFAGINQASTLTAAVQRAAKQRLVDLVDAGNLNADQLAQAIPDKVALFAFLGLIKNQTLFEQLFNAITDQQELARFSIEGSTSKLRQRAAEKIVDKTILQNLLKEVKAKDKTVFKIIKEKCDAFKEEEKRIAEINAAVLTSVQHLEQLSKRPYDGQFTAKLSYLTQQWEAKKADASAELVARAKAAIESCQATIDNISAEQAAEEAARKAQANADAERQAHIQQLQSVFTSVVSADVVNVEETQALLKLLDSAWQSLCNVKSPSAAEQKTVDGLLRAIQTELSHHQTSGSLSAQKSHFEQLVVDASLQTEEYYHSLKKRVSNVAQHFTDAVPGAITSAQKAYQEWEKAAHEKAAELQNTQRHIAGLIRKANDTINEGVLGKAIGIRRAIDEKLQGLAQLPGHLSSQLEQLDEALAKLQDWKNYAVVPKKHELIAQLEALVDSKDHPEALANKIKRIQEEWRSLSKGGKDQDQDLWEKFHDLAQKVYQPCRDYFAEQAKIRQQNLESCKQLVVQLKDYLANYSWDTANWKDVEKVIRVARAEWRNYSPTERAASQPVLEEFEATLAIIQQKLNDDLAKNAGLKKDLINKAKELVNLEDSRKATDLVKQMQASWQAIGASFRKEEQQLWREFRDACDAVFAKRQQQSAEFKAELDANFAAAKDLVAEVQSLTLLNGAALMEATKRLDEIRQAFGGLGQFPKAQVNEIKHAFNQAVENFDKKLKDERAATKQQVWVNLFSANQQVNDYEFALVKGSVVDVDALHAAIDAIPQWPSGCLKAMQQKIARANAGTDLQANLVALRELCIRAEILTDTQTPASEQALRTAFQVNQLQQSFGRKGQDLAADIENLVFEWIAVGAVDPVLYGELFARFNACRVKALNN